MAPQRRLPGVSAPVYGMAAHGGGAARTYELLDPTVDDRHRSALRSNLLVMQTRPLGELWTIDPRWIGRLRDAGLLPLARMVQAIGQLASKGGDGFALDRSLLTALVDRWRPETHTFHLPCGEMAPTLQDVSMLTGMPIVGPAVFLEEPGKDWREQLLQRFQGVLPRDKPYEKFSHSH